MRTVSLRLTCALDYGDLHGIGQVTGGGWDFNQRNMSGDYRFAKTLLIWDTNPPNSQPHNWHFCMEAKDAGANLVVIDPDIYNRCQTGHQMGSHQAGDRPCAWNRHFERHRRERVVRSRLSCVIKHAPPCWCARTTAISCVAPISARRGRWSFPSTRSTACFCFRPREANKVPTVEVTAHVYVVWDADANTCVRIERNEESSPRGTLRDQRREGDHRMDSAQRSFGRIARPNGPNEITEVPADTIVELARMYACDTPSTIYAGYHLYDNCEVMGMTWATMAALDRQHRQERAPPSGISARTSPISIVRQTCSRTDLKRSSERHSVA